MHLFLLTLLFAVSSFANLPDEINYRPYQEKYKTLSNELDKARNSLNLQMSELEDILLEVSLTQTKIAHLNTSIADQASNLDKLNRSIPVLRSKKRRVESDISIISQEIRINNEKLSRLKSKIVGNKSKLSPIQKRLNRERQLEGELRKRIVNVNSTLQNLRSTIVQRNKKLQELTKRVNTAKSNIKSIKDKQQAYKLKINTLTKSNTDLTAQIRTLKSRYTGEHSQLTQTKAKIETKDREIAKLRRDGAPASKIENALKELSSLKSLKRKISSRILKINSKIRSNNNIIEQNNKNIASIKDFIKKAPGLIARDQKVIKSAQTNSDKLQKQISDLKSKEKNSKLKLADAKNKQQKHTESIARLEKEAAPLKNKLNELVSRQTRISQILNTDLKRRTEISKKLTGLNLRLTHVQREIPRVQSSIASSQDSLSVSHRHLSLLQRNEDSIRSDIESSNSLISNLEYDQSFAKDEFQKRLNLFNSYKAQAQSIGSSQNTNGSEFGHDAGIKYLNQVVNKYSKMLSDEIGSHKAKLQGTVRGEIDGYRSGYDDGLNSSDSISQGQIAGDKDGKRNAYQHAQNVLRPQFFEEFLTNLFGNTTQSTLSLDGIGFTKAFPSREIVDEMVGNVPSLTELELELTNKFKTSLDSHIGNLIKSDIQLDKKLHKYTRASFVFEGVSFIPYQAVDCSSVYKGLAVYKKACLTSYKESFRHAFNSEVKDVFYTNYQGDFTATYNRLVDIKVDSLITEYFNRSRSIAYTEANTIGKKDAYNQSYDHSYNLSYSNQLLIESSTASTQARSDVQSWIASNSVVTINSISFSRPQLKGGDIGELVIVLKNVSNVDSLASGIVNLQNLRHVSFAQDSFKLINVMANSSAIMKIPFSVSKTASSFDTLNIDTEFILQGDMYKTSRVEQLSVQKKLSKNAKFDVSYHYNSTPKVKGFRTYYVHSFDFEITSTVEGISEGYDVELIPLDGAEKYLSFKQNSLNTSSTEHNVVNKTSVTYVFSKRARKRKISFNAIIKYQGVIQSTKVIEMTPR